MSPVSSTSKHSNNLHATVVSVMPLATTALKRNLIHFRLFCWKIRYFK